MANTYQSAYTGPIIDRAGRLPDPTSGSVGQILKKNDVAGNMIFADPSAGLFFVNTAVTTSTWQSNNTYVLYPYSADIPCVGVTSSFFPQVIFNLDEALSGYFAPVCESYGTTTANGGIRIFASDIPSDDFLIPTIIAFQV